MGKRRRFGNAKELVDKFEGKMKIEIR